LHLEAAVTARILVVDDVPAIRRSMGLVLEQEGDWTICGEAENGKVAIDRVRELRPNVVILDLSMPVMNGLEAARVIKTIAPGTRILNVYPAHLPAFVGRGRKAGI
jgi:two-component system chemotaxis response regulator CheY